MHTSQKAVCIGLSLAVILLALLKPSYAAGQPTPQLFLPLVARSFAAVPPAAPGNLQANVIGHTAFLTWEDKSDNEASFEVEAVPTDGSGSQSATVPAGETSVTIDLPSAGEWAFTAWARNAYGQSDPSNTANATVSQATLTIFNQSGLSILSLRIDGEPQPLLNSHIPSGGQAEFSLSTWEHSYSLELGITGTTQAVIYGANGELNGHISAFPEENNAVYVLHPQVTEIMTRFGQSGAWVAQVHTSSGSYTSVYCFYQDGRFTEWDASETPAIKIDQGTYSGDQATLLINIGLHGSSEQHAEYDEIQKWFAVTEKDESQYQGDADYVDFCPLLVP